MPSVNLIVEMTVDNLLEAVAKLNEEELVAFEAGFERIWLRRAGLADIEAAQIVEKHRLPLHQRARVRELLWKNQEDCLTEEEEEELDAYMAQMDQALEGTAEELLTLTESRQKGQVNGRS